MLRLTITCLLLWCVPAQAGWQTYCAVEDAGEGSPSPTSELIVKRVGRASPDIRSAHLFTSDGKLRVWDTANKKQFEFTGTGFSARDSEPCPTYVYRDVAFPFGSGFVSACEGTCVRAEIMPRTLPFVFAGHGNSVFVGTSHGDALLYSIPERTWCRMQRTGDTYECPPGPKLPIVTKPSNQFYSSVTFNERTLIGEYPTGRLYEFDGQKVFPSDMTPPPYQAGPPGGSESQTLAVYCGALYVGYWPDGSLWRYDGNWSVPIPLFTGDPGVPFQKEAQSAGQIFNFFGRKVSSLVVHDGSLWAITSNTGDWTKDIRTLPQKAADQYGMLWRIGDPNCATPRHR